MLLAAIFGVAIGLAVGALGGGGSVLTVAVLVYVLGQDVAEATTASLAIVGGGALAAAVPGIALGTIAAGALDVGAAARSRSSCSPPRAPHG